MSVRACCHRLRIPMSCRPIRHVISHGALYPAYVFTLESDEETDNCAGKTRQRQAGRQTNRQTDAETSRRGDKQTRRQADTETKSKTGEVIHDVN